MSIHHASPSSATISIKKGVRKQKRDIEHRAEKAGLCRRRRAKDKRLNHVFLSVPMMCPFHGSIPCRREDVDEERKSVRRRDEEGRVERGEEGGIEHSRNHSSSIHHQRTTYTFKCFMDFARGVKE
jgi:hypothetical protein